MARKRKPVQRITAPVSREKRLLSTGVVEVYADEGEYHARYAMALYGRGSNHRLALADLVRQLQSLAKEVDAL